MKKEVLPGQVISNQPLGIKIQKMKIKVPVSYEIPQPGQFINVYPKNAATLLPRPISVCDFEQENGEGVLTLVYGVVGAGTAEFSTYEEGDFIRISSPLGKGYSLDETFQSAMLIGGGIGVPPMVYLAKTLKKRDISTVAVVGFKEQGFLIDTLKDVCDEIYVSFDNIPDEASEESPLNRELKTLKGTVLEMIKTWNLSAEAYFACGPKPMLAALSQYTESINANIQVSLEERMGCGYGACVGCVCKIKDIQANRLLQKKVCKDGPVFRGSEVDWQ